MKKMLDWLLDLFYPPRCAFCRRLLNEKEKGVCRFCRKTYENRCIRRELAHCSCCVAPLSYEGAVRDSLLRYKFRDVAAYGAAYADFLAKCIDESQISCDIITWVPLSRRRLRRRGYDQARILAEETAKRLNLPCEKLLEKRVDTKPQSGIRDAESRRKNAKGVYVCCAPSRAEGKHILLIDDIVTTGATLSECAAMLKQAGCAAVVAAAAASRQQA
ncbi:MAG: ComF family protein [Oscillospiraceae bacterium]|nr:ComF family protein [Oscillospiraceae bacterium]